MKKLLTMAAIALFTMTSCSEDDATPTDNTNPSNAVLVKKIVTTGPEGVLTALYSYNGTKLSEINYSDGSREIITYQGDLIKTWKTYDADNTNTYEGTFSYENGELRESVSIFDNDGIVATKTYTDNGDGTISCLKTYSDTNLIWNYEFYPTKYSYLVPSFFGEGSNLTWYYFEFDNKNSPYANIIGYGKIVHETDFNPLQAEHNITGETWASADGAFTGQSRTSTYTYNSQDYPVTEHRVDSDINGDDQSDIQYFYE